ncbi:hypothetical protein [Mangrovibacterium sp.]|uniref:hypothetical protein n=1 Tax=Mangrovibacterium sp. TaxID=1961364 RepID=UPI003568C47B
MSEQNKPAVVATMEQFSFFNPEHLATMQRVGKMFANSELVPEMYKSSDNNPPEKAIANCVVAIEIATRIGASPLMVMQNMVPIYGKPSWSSKFLISTVNTCGRFKPLRFKFENLGVLKDYKYKEYVSEWVTGNNGKKYKKTALVDKVFAGPVDNIQCIAYTTAKNSDEELESSPVSVKMAIDEGWYTKKGSKWQTMTKQMLMYRSASFWTSSYAPELSMGMKTEDEMRDIEDVTFVDVTDHTPERSKDEKSNSKELSIDDAPKDKERAEETPKPSLQKMTFTSMDEVKKFLIDDCGAAEEFLTDDAAINTVAAENGISIEIKAAGGPGF